MTHTDNRLMLRPLNAAELALALEDYAELELALGLRVTPAATLMDDEEMRYAMRVRYAKVLQDEQKLLLADHVGHHPPGAAAAHRLPDS
ncbi:hypothetical protein ACFSQ7_10245 [Paenibacillus rhizoplanae]